MAAHGFKRGAGIALMLLGIAAGAARAEKTRGVFLPAERRQAALANIAQHPWAQALRDTLVARAKPWMKYSDDDLWAMIFGATISRSHMVWSDGFCPACKKPVTMYTWKFDPLNKPWKLWCPQCRAAFPTNDFEKFYRSGLDARGVFDPAKADRALLFNAEHPDPNDPLHRFGVDDGEGYLEGDKRWRFIGWYLVAAHWRALILPGIDALAAAYVVTGDPAYAHRAGILLDRLADVWPSFDYKKQGYVYEVQSSEGHIGYSIDNCEHVRTMVIAYDRIFDALKTDAALAAFLAAKAKAHALENPKASFADIQRNIEQNIFGDVLRNPKKIHCNYPRVEMTTAAIKAVLDWPKSRPEVERILDGIIRNATEADGLTGEKGLVGYGSWAIQGLAETLCQYDAVDSAFLNAAFERHPQLRRTYRFHIDTWVFQRFYPFCGDGGGYARRYESYGGLRFNQDPLDPSMYSFLWRLYQWTRDPAYVQVMVGANRGAVDGLPHDLFCADPAAVQKEAAEVIAQHGLAIPTRSVNKTEWHLAILAQGDTQTGTALWLDYDTWGPHGHNDGMNLGLFARGMDLMPEYGYPRVEYGGWGSARARWYRDGGPAHNTVIVDRKLQEMSGGKFGSGLQKPVGGRTTLWADGDVLKAVRASAPEIVKTPQYERTVGWASVADADGYLFDIFRVVGGSDHAKFQHTLDATVTLQGLSLAPADPWVFNMGGGKTTEEVLRNFRTDTAPKPGWSVNWALTPFYKDDLSDLRLRYTDWTTGAEASLCDSWVKHGSGDSDILWLPTVMVRRAAQGAPASFASTFVALLEPYRGQTPVAQSERLTVRKRGGAACSDANVALRVTLRDGRKDLILSRDVENPLKQDRGVQTLLVSECDATMRGDFAFVRWAADGSVERIGLHRVATLTVGALEITTPAPPEYLELALTPEQARLIHGPAAAGVQIRFAGKAMVLAP